MEKQFNLSEKIVQPYAFEKDFVTEHINVNDVKEFIRLLKEKYRELNDKNYIGEMSPIHQLAREIDKLAGDKINGKTN
jgi:hemerythrin superfamily protein